MSERVYAAMKSVGISNLVVGIVIIVAGIAAGVCVIVNGAKMLQKRSELLF